MNHRQRKHPSRKRKQALLDIAHEEQANGARPAIAETVENFEQYDTVYFGFPNWWGDMPMILYTFLDEYDFSGKTIVPFCTSGSTGIAGSEGDLHALAESAAWKEGRRFSAGTTAQTVREWLEELQLLGGASA